MPVLSRFFKNKEIIAEAPSLGMMVSDLIDDAYLIIRQDTNEIVDFNNSVKLLFQLPDETDLKKLMLTQIMMRYLAEDSPNKELLMNQIPDNWCGEAGFITFFKERFYTYLKSFIVFREDIKYQVLLIKDISDKIHLEKELAYYKANVEKAAQAKARFLSTMSHELRTPLNGIIGNSNLILSEPDIPEGIRKHTKVLRYSSEHMLCVINDILDYSKIDAGKLELKKKSFNLSNCLLNITRALEVQFKNKSIELITDIQAELNGLEVKSDEIKLSQVLNNLLSNALKFTHDGSVTLKVSIECKTSTTRTILFEVTDTGIGIPKEKQSLIFEGFAQVHEDQIGKRVDGTGLGLTISEKLVHKFGGKLKVESSRGNGSRFYFSIQMELEPEADTDLDAANLNKDGFPIDTRGLRVLVVEDNDINASILISFLKKWGMQIKEATNGVHALELIKYHTFDIVLMDLEMPEMDGYETITKLRAINSTLPVIAFTATLLENMNSIISPDCFNDYVIKPYRPAELKKKILHYAPHRQIDYA